jgi:hypothetical protein
VFLLVFGALVASYVQAGLIHVPGDYSTVADGLGAAVSGDTVLVAIGAYSGPGEVDVVPGVTLLGIGDWSSGQCPAPATVFVSGLNVRLVEGTEPAIVENIWFYNDSVTCLNPDGVVRRCRFGDDVGQHSGWYMVRLDNGGIVEHCFICNPSDQGTAETPIQVEGGSAIIRHNVGNFDTGAFVSLVSGPPPILEQAIIRDNTFVSNLGVDLAIKLWDVGSADIRIVNNILEGKVWCSSPASPEVAHNCFLYPGWIFAPCSAPADSNIVADPQFCVDLEPPGPHLLNLDTYYLEPSSPCLGTGENGSDIGALGICGTSAVSPSTVPEHRFRLAVQPNPVTHRATFVFEPTATPLMLEIYGADGRFVASLRAHRGATWYPGRSVRSGVYFAHLQGDGVSEVARFVLVR